MKTFIFTAITLFILVFSMNAQIKFNAPETKRVPVTNEVHGFKITDLYQWLEDKDNPEVKEWYREYAAECDKLADMKSPRVYSKKFGRWCLVDDYLVTTIVRPKINEYGSFVSGTYEIELSRKNEDWLSHLRGKVWMGDSGLRDLSRALQELTIS